MCCKQTKNKKRKERKKMTAKTASFLLAVSSRTLADGSLASMSLAVGYVVVALPLKKCLLCTEYKEAIIVLTEAMR